MSDETEDRLLINIDPNVLTAIGAIITALAVLVTGVTGLVVAIRTKKAVAEVHTLVNSNSTEQVRRIDQLTQVITKTVGNGKELPAIQEPRSTGVPPIVPNPPPPTV